MIGGGTVGGGVYELLQRHDAPVTMTHICVRDTNKPRDFQLVSTTTTLTTNVSDLKRVDCLVEVAGGSGGVICETVLQALRDGKTVVTANKALIAEHLSSITALLSSSNAKLGFEAAVCGGIPIINLLQTAYVGDTIQSIQGICNGTTNYMLCAMQQGADYAEILKQAQDLGFAEADPTADVEGHDVRAKICILAYLAFGKVLPVLDIPCSGITQITALDFAILKTHCQNATIKLLGCAQTNSNGDNNNKELSVYVAPHVVPHSHSLASIHGPGNCVSVVSENMGCCSYTGPGAGRYPTANSVVADIYRAANGTLPNLRAPSDDWTFVNDYTSRFYIRLSGDSVPETSLKIASTIDHEGTKVLFTEPAKHSEVKAFCESFQVPLYMPMLE